MLNKLDQVKFDCKYFRGAIPCKPNKLRGKICHNCNEYRPITKRILIIKLGAMGDVIRTTPLLVKLKSLYPDAHFTWITWTPDILPSNEIDEIFPFDFTSTYIVRNQKFDIAINLDKEYEACSLLSEVKSEEKYGFTLKDHHIAAATKNAEHKLITGFFDEISQQNTKHYVQEIFEICHLDFNDEEYLLSYPEEYESKFSSLHEKAKGKKLIGLNTGCGKRWLTRLWPEEKWVELIQKLQEKGYYPVVLGGPDEDERNRYYAGKTDAYYPGTYSLKEFIALTDQFDLIVTAVSMMMHIATGLKKPMILFNNIFNKHEFYLYGRGEIVEPRTGCDDFYGTHCSRDKHCMEDLYVDDVVAAIERHLP